MAHAAAVGVWSLIVLRALMAFGEGANWPAGGKAIARWLPPDRSAFAMGVFDGGSALGAVLAPPVVWGFQVWFGWRGAFIATGLLGMFWLLAWFWIYDDPTATVGSRCSNGRRMPRSFAPNQPAARAFGPRLDSCFVCGPCGA